ncbi:TRAP transporter substrate-binding protein [Cuneatibacter sp. NSJ-177]|jgi:TRAP-type C4-dicarboxylate transport system substrate-binding protein|uniref:TRAP transporter substrate-binding protein n=1 Tax=Cuneatibacter sp. NSJ-177 TaxID=2931401 RepID=UPI001FD02F8D|nr:TRAP transporter substrate-binding protein [Cuneatibacter sp. NSJ-177]MCJ7834964.1 TRAP transporter substrate-binding protein [Cuneatibacter sp. NSJ-177]
MKRIKRYGIWLLAVLLFTSCASENPVSAPPTEAVSKETKTPESEALYLSLASCGNWTDSPQGIILAEQLEKLEEQSGGLVKIRSYDRYRLGDDVRVVHGVRLGTLDMIQSVPGSQTSAIPEAALLEVPGLFDSLDQWNEFLAGPYLDVMREYYSAAGIKLLAVFACSYRELSSDREVVTPQDLKGLRVRVIENAYHEAFWNSLGAQAVPYSFEELRFCLQEGIAQGQENPIGTLLAENLMDLQTTITITKHMPMIYVLAMNEDRFESLTEEQEKFIMGFADDLREELIRQMPEREEQVLETLRNDYGLQVVEPSKELKEMFRQGGNVVLDLLRKNLGDEKVDEMLAEAEKVRTSSQP